jgi:ATP adenylyltransferase
MKRIWSPWRLRYVAGGPKKSGGCIFCDKAAAGTDMDRQNYLLYRGEKGLMILNLYPYNNGHFMVAPYVHVPSVENLDAATMGSLMELVNKGIAALRETMHPEGFNIGINLGSAAGAGIIDHVHIHVVPRWVGDTNFMPIFSETKVIPELLDATYDKLKAALGRGERE